MAGDRFSRDAIAYAFVADRFTRTNDALRGLAPLFEQAITSRAGSIFDAASVAAEVNAQFDLSVSPLIVEGLVPALEAEGLLQKVTGVGDSVLYKCVAAAGGEPQRATRAQIEDIFGRFAEFASRELEKHGVSFARAELDERLLEVVSTTDFLQVALRSDPDRFRGRRLSLRRADEPDSAGVKAQALDVLAAEFVSECERNDPEAFGLLLSAAWGALIAEVVLSLRTPSKDSNIASLTVFLDGPLILDLLDIGSAEGHAYALDLFALLKKSGAKLATFSHVVNEMTRAITVPLQRMEQALPATGVLVRRIREEPSHLAYVKATLLTLPEKLKAHGIQIFDDSDFERAELEQFFDQGAIDSLRNSLGEPHLNLERRDRDARSVAYVARARGGEHAISITDSKAVFLTRNVGLARKAQEYLERVGSLPAYHAPVCVTDRQFAGVLWFCSGSGGEQNLTRLKLVANCANAVVPRRELVTQFAQHLFDTNPALMPEFAALLRDKRASMCLVHETLNVAAFAKADDVLEILDAMRRSLTEDARREFEKELVDATQHLEQDREKLRNELEQERIRNEEELRIQREALQGELTQAASAQREIGQRASEETFRLQNLADDERARADAAVRDADHARDSARRMSENVDRGVERLAGRIARVVEAAAGLLLVIGTYFVLLAAYRGVSLESLGVPAAAAALTSVVILGLIGWFGWSHSNINKWVSTYLRQKIASWLR